MMFVAKKYLNNLFWAKALTLTVSKIIRGYPPPLFKSIFSKNRHISVNFHPNVPIFNSDRENSFMKPFAKFHLDIWSGSIFRAITGCKILFSKFPISRVNFIQMWPFSIANKILMLRSSMGNFMMTHQGV